MNYLRVGDMAKEANFVFLAIFSGGRPFFSAVFHVLAESAPGESRPLNPHGIKATELNLFEHNIH